MRKVELLREQYPTILHEYTELEELSGTDILTLLKHFNELSSHVDIVDLLKSLTAIILHHSGADLFALVIEQDEKMLIQAIGTAEPGKTEVMQSLPLEEVGSSEESPLPVEMLRYIKRTNEDLVVYDGHPENIFYNIPYIRKKKPRSAVCIKTDTERCKVIWYLENRLMSKAFPGEKMILLGLLSRQAAICIHNAISLREQKKAIQTIGFSFRYIDQIKIVPYNDIVYISSHGRHSVVHTLDRTYDIPKLLKDIVNELPGDVFTRIHRQYLVNLEFISYFKRNNSSRFDIYLSDNDDTRIAVGRSYRAAIKQIFKHGNNLKK